MWFRRVRKGLSGVKGADFSKVRSGRVFLNVAEDVRLIVAVNSENSGPNPTEKSIRVNLEPIAIEKLDEGRKFTMVQANEDERGWDRKSSSASME